MNGHIITQQSIDSFLSSIAGEEGKNTKQYRKVLEELMKRASEQDFELTKQLISQWREELLQKGYCRGSVTNRIVCVNKYCRFMGWNSLCFDRGGKIDLTGRHFGTLTVLYPTEKHSSDRSIIWVCRCDACGKEKEIPANQLMNGVQQSCGCQKIVKLSKSNGYIDGTCMRMIFSDKISKNNTSGCKGVYYKRGRWAARIQYKKKIYYLGSYDRFEDAKRARHQAEQWVRDDAEQLMKEYSFKLS